MKMLCQVSQVVVGAGVGVVGFGLQKNRLSRKQRGSSVGLYLPSSRPPLVVVCSVCRYDQWCYFCRKSQESRGANEPFFNKFFI